MEKIFLNCNFKNKKEALEKVFDIFREYNVPEDYIKSIHKREKMSSFSIGYSIAIPHGTYEASMLLHDSLIIILHINSPIKWDGESVQIIVGLAIREDKQIDILQNIAINAMNENFFNDMLNNPTKEKLVNFTKEEEKWI
ncbi:PTS sugar transporter subunit IIA [Spiroplasma endosymbiont of Aspidapion aeneum]|uniref:PTS sugar transporter subunit IIA n=1 Tax=Spiroplasma endosymbiont of Aspidapion aeneum TaxID=3066276 RepID=UPI00313DCE64